MTVAPAETREDEAACGSGVYSDGHHGEHLRIPSRVRAASILPVLVNAKVSLQTKCKKCLCAGERLSRCVRPVLAFAGMFNCALDEPGYPAAK